MLPTQKAVQAGTGSVQADGFTMAMLELPNGRFETGLPYDPQRGQ
jgi:hypothetical protein